MSRNDSSLLQYLPLFWPVPQSRAAVEHNKECLFLQNFTYSTLTPPSLLKKHLIGELSVEVGGQPNPKYFTPHCTVQVYY
jgi:hypothetical protein